VSVDPYGYKNGTTKIFSLYIAILYKITTGAARIHTIPIFTAVSFNPKRRDKKRRIPFQHKKPIEMPKKTMLAIMPSNRTVLGGGSTMYRIDVKRNHPTVGMSE
jgi:hypothetical protein